MSAKSQIYAYLHAQYPAWTSGADLERMQWKNEDGTTAKPSIAGRRARELESESCIAGKHEGKKKDVRYKYLPPIIRPHYITLEDRTDNMFSKTPSEIRYLLKHGRGEVEDGVYKMRV